MVKSATGTGARHTGRAIRGIVIDRVIAICLLIGGVAAVRAQAPAPAPAAPVTYKVIDLGSLGGASWASGINDKGQVVGGSEVGAGTTHAFLWENGKMRDLGALSGLQGVSLARKINAKGQVAGQAFSKEDKGAAFLQATLWQGSKAVDLAGPPSQAWGINAAGQVVGEWKFHAFLYQSGHPTDLGTLGGKNSGAIAINDQGAVVGESFTADGSVHACLWESGSLTDLRTFPAGKLSWALGINNKRQVVGKATLNGADPRGPTHAFLWENGKMQDLGTLPGFTTSRAEAIDDNGRIVGSLFPGRDTGSFDPNTHAFIWEAGKMIDLNALIASGSGWTLNKATGINASGQVCGYGELKGSQRAFLLTPTTTAPPATAPAAPKGKAPGS